LVHRAIRERRQPPAPQIDVAVTGPAQVGAAVLRAPGADDHLAHRLARAVDAEPAPRGTVDVEAAERRRILRHELRRRAVVQCVEELIHAVERGAPAVHGPRRGRLPGQHDRILSLDEADRVDIGRRRRGEGEPPRDGVRAAGEALGGAPQEQHDGQREDDQPELFRAHQAPPAPASASGRYTCRVIWRRRHSRKAPKTISSTGTPMMLPYFTTSCVVALANASGGGVRFFERIAIKASSCASQSTAFWTNTMLSGEFCAYRSLAKSGLPTITSRACVAPAAPGAAAGLSCAARSRGRRLSRRNSREGSRNAVVSWTPPAR